MKSRYSNVLMLLAAIFAFIPVLAVDFLLDNYVRGRERVELQNRTEAIAARVSAGMSSGLAALRTIVGSAPNPCSPAFLQASRDLMIRSLTLKDVLVENQAGLQYCDGLGQNIAYTVLSPTLTLPGSAASLQIIRVDSISAPLLKIGQAFGQQKVVSALVPLVPDETDRLLDGFDPGSVLSFVLSDGTVIADVGDVVGYTNRGRTEFITASAYAGDSPIEVRTAVPFAIVRAQYGALDTSFTLLTSLMCAAFLLLALRHVRRSDLPAFDLERAIAAGELKPYYQPIIHLRTGELIGCEVLCRWEKRSGEVVPPGRFIEYAEVTGLAIPMTLSLMQQVRQDLSELCSEQPGLRLSINLFEGHFRDARIVEDVQSVFSGSSISYRQLVFEITERSPIGQHQAAGNVIAGLHALGCRLALDDAGTGHSNLAYLQTLGVDIIKIDRVFVDMIKPGIDHVPVLDGLITMATQLSTDVVAEGVETEEQAVYLRNHGVVLAQGFLFAQALKAASFRDLARALNKPAIVAPVEPIESEAASEPSPPPPEEETVEAAAPTATAA